MQENSQKQSQQPKQIEKIEKDEDDESESASSQCFMNFVNSYSRFINEQSDTCLEMDSVLQFLNDNIDDIKPPNEGLNEFHQSLLITPHQIHELASQLKQLPDSKLYQCIQNIEKLDYKLQIDTDLEIQKAQDKDLI